MGAAQPCLRAPHLPPLGFSGLSPSAHPVLCPGPKGHHNPIGALRAEPRTGRQSPSLPAEEGSCSGPHPARLQSSLNPWPSGTLENVGSPRPSLVSCRGWSLAWAGERESSPRLSASGHLMPALGWPQLWPASPRWLEHLGLAPPGPLPPPPAPLTGCACWGTPWGSLWPGRPWGIPSPGSLCSAP